MCVCTVHTKKLSALRRSIKCHRSSQMEVFFFCHGFFFWFGSSYGLQADAASFIVSFNKIFFFCMTARLLDTRALNANSRFFFLIIAYGMKATTISLRASAASLRLFKSVCGSEDFFFKIYFLMRVACRLLFKSVCCLFKSVCGSRALEQALCHKRASLLLQ